MRKKNMKVNKSKKNTNIYPYVYTHTPMDI